MWAQVSFVLSQCTHLTDRQIDRQMDGKAFAILCVALHAVTPLQGESRWLKNTTTYCKRIGNLHRRLHVGEQQVRLEN